MNKSVILVFSLLVAAGIFGGIIFAAINQQKVTPSTGKSPAQQIVLHPSITLKAYSDPSGFTFSYPDNLSIAQNEMDTSTYADLVLTTKDIEGMVHIVISDTKIALLDAWTKSFVGTTAVDSSLNGLKAKELKGSDGMRLGAIDQGVLFTIEVTPKGNGDYWTSVYDAVKESFSFDLPSQSSFQAQGASAPQGDGAGTSDIEFAGEEIIE